MAYSAPSSVTTGDLITASTWNQDVVDNIIALKAQLDTFEPELTNGSGDTRTAGDVIVAGTGADESFTTTTTAGDPNVIGVVKASSIGNGESGIVALAGSIAYVLCTTAAVDRGDLLQTSTTAGQAQAGNVNPFGKALEAKSAGSTGLVKAYIFDNNLLRSFNATFPWSYSGVLHYGTSYGEPSPTARLIINFDNMEDFTWSLSVELKNSSGAAGTIYFKLRDLTNSVDIANSTLSAALDTGETTKLTATPTMPTSGVHTIAVLLTHSETNQPTRLLVATLNGYEA